MKKKHELVWTLDSVTKLLKGYLTSGDSPEMVNYLRWLLKHLRRKKTLTGTQVTEIVSKELKELAQAKQRALGRKTK